MITREDDVDIHALRRQGWTITAIANHVGRDRKTVRDYLNGKRDPGVRKRALDPFAPFVDYVTARLTEDPHLWGITLFDELQPLGFDASYPTLTRQIRARNLRPVCTDCGRVTERANAIIPHPAGEETQWDWLDLPDPPDAWGWGSMAHLLVGSLAHSGRWRGYLSPVMDQPHLVEGLDRISRGLGGLTRQWRFDRMATVCHPGSGRITATFSGVAKHYGVMIKICPARAGHRKGVVEKSTTPRRNAGGAPSPTRRPPNRPKSTATGSPASGGTPGCAVAPPVTGRPPWPPSRPGNRCGRCRRRRIRCCWPSPGWRHGRRWSATAATSTRCHPNWPPQRSPCPAWSAPRSATSPPAPESWSPDTGSPRTAPASWSVTTVMSPPSTPSL